MAFAHTSRTLLTLGVAALALAGCAMGGSAGELPSAAFVAQAQGPSEDYVIGPLDQLTIFVWRNPELGAKVQVRPDGRITTPLIADLPAVGKTPAMLAADIKLQLATYIKDPIVSVIVDNFSARSVSKSASSARPRSPPRSPIART